MSRTTQADLSRWVSAENEHIFEQERKKQSPLDWHKRDRVHHAVLSRKFAQVLRQCTQEGRRVVHIIPLCSYA